MICANSCEKRAQCIHTSMAKRFIADVAETRCTSTLTVDASVSSVEDVVFLLGKVSIWYKRSGLQTIPTLVPISRAGLVGCNFNFLNCAKVFLFTLFMCKVGLVSPLNLQNKWMILVILKLLTN